MTNRERVIAAIRREPTDYLPHQLDFTQEEFEKVLTESGDPNFGSRLNNHIIFSGLCDFYEDSARPGFYTDNFGVVWNRTKDKDIGVVDSLLLENPEFNSYIFPEIDEAKIKKHIETVIEVNRKEQKFLVFNISFSMFERAWTLRGMENILIDFIENPGFVHDLMQRICRYNLHAIEIAAAYKEVDSIMFGDDWGQQKGLIMGSGYWREYIKPYVAQMYSAAKSAGKIIIQHSCGDISTIFPDLIEIGLDVYQTFQPEIYDIADIKARYGEKLSFWGGISTQTLLPVADAETVKSEVIRIMKLLGQGGGYIAAPTHGMPRDIPTENVLVMLNIFLNQKKYGIEF